MTTTNGQHAPIDYRSLIQDRRAKQKRQTIRHIICLDPTLFGDLEVLKDEQSLTRFTTPDSDKSAGDVRLGAPTLSSKIAAVEARIAEVSVVGVFKVPTADRQAEINRQNEDAEPLDTVRALLVECLVNFETSRDETIPAEQLGRDDLAELLPEMAQGELLALGNRIIEASGGAPDLPLSVRQSLLSRRSAETSKRRSPSASPANGSTAGSPAPSTATTPTDG